MAIGTRTVSTNDRYAGPHNIEHFVRGGTIGTVSSAPTSTIMVMTRDGIVTGSVLSGTMGVDASNPLSISFQATNLNTGSNIFTTVPSLAKSAGNKFVTTAAGAATGIVAGTLDSAQVAVTKGDPIKIVWTLTRTASPGTEILDVAGALIIAEKQDFDPTVG